MNSLRQNSDDKRASKLVRTGYRMLKILTLLLEKPCSYQEINESFLSDSYLKKEVSDDMICMYMNSLRNIGCDISRPSKSNGFCYVLNSAPFSFTITKSQSKIIEAILKSLIKNNDWKLLIDVCDFFKKIQTVCSPSSDLDFLRVISLFMKMDFDLIQKLNYYCEKEKYIIIEYLSPNSGLKEIGLLAKNISLENSRLYFWGYSEELQEMQYLRVERIKKIKVISLKEVNVNHQKFPVAKYKVNKKDFAKNNLENNQKIIKETDDTIWIEEEVINKFKFVQTILSYGEDCVLLEPEDIRQEVILALKEILAFYE